MFACLKQFRATPAITEDQAEALIAGTPEELTALKQKLWVAILSDTATDAEIRQYELIRRRLREAPAPHAH